MSLSESLKAQKEFSTIVDTDIYEIIGINGKQITLSGEELKAYIIMFRGQMNFDFSPKKEQEKIKHSIEWAENATSG